MTGQHDPHPGHVDCSQVLLRIFEYLDGELDAADLEHIASHLQECRPCLAEHDIDRTVKELVRRCCPPEPAPMALRLRIVEQITITRY